MFFVMKPLDGTRMTHIQGGRKFGSKFKTINILLKNMFTSM